MEHRLSAMQAKLLEILRWYHDFCEAHHLRYYLLGGTMLGAARHQGFIPWDDDIDVGMPRADYEEFLRLTYGQKFGKYIVEGIGTPAKDFLYGYAKIYDFTTTLVERTRYRIKRGIYIDLFPLDGVSDTPEEIPDYYRTFARKYNLLLTRNCALRHRAWYKNAAILLARTVPNFILNNQKLMRSIDELARSRSYDDCEYVGNLYGNWGERELMKKSVLGTPTPYRFEDLTVYGAEDSDAYLTSLYGDWRQLPPKDRQVSHHDYLLCDLTKSYME